MKSVALIEHSCRLATLPISSSSTRLQRTPSIQSWECALAATPASPVGVVYPFISGLELCMQPAVPYKQIHLYTLSPSALSPPPLRLTHPRPPLGTFSFEGHYASSCIRRYTQCVYPCILRTFSLRGWPTPFWGDRLKCVFDLSSQSVLKDRSFMKILN